MKGRLFLLFLTILTVTIANAQNQKPTIPANTTTNDSIYQTLQRIKNILDEKNYTRVPNQDFDKTLENKVNQKVEGEIHNTMDIIKTIFIAAIGILGITSFLSIRTIVNYSVKDKLSEVEQNIKTELDKKNDAKLEYIEKTLLNNVELQYLKNIEKETVKIREEVKKMILDSQHEMDAKIDNFKYYLIDNRLERLKKDIDDRLKPQETFNSLMKMLPEVEELNNTELISRIIQLLSTASYYSKNDDEMEKILIKYMNNSEIKIDASVFLTIASGIFYSYDATGYKPERDKAFIYLNESLKRATGYGEALGLKLEYLMIDLERSTDDREKDKIKLDSKIIIEQIKKTALSGQEVIKRFTRVKPSKTENYYIQRLYELFPDDMKTIETMASPSTDPKQN